jgi:hypothetical protein
MIASYKFFMTPMCPNCGEIHEYLDTLKIKGTELDATTEEGLSEAEGYGVMSVPTMIFLDRKGKEVNRANSIADIKKILENKSLMDL